LRTYQISDRGGLRLEFSLCRLLLSARRLDLRSDFLRHLVAILPQFFFSLFQTLRAFFFQQLVTVSARFAQRIVVFVQLVLGFSCQRLGLL
jgi:hypothetical protein